MSTVRVNIDGRTIDVPAGTLVTDAARMAEIHVPIFCSHSKLPPLGACRICVVEIGTPKLGPDRKPVLAADGTPEIAWMPKVQTGCTTPVTEGMHVRTKSAVAEKSRKGVMEFLLVNHPLDCPVCDEGGECQLQDLAFAFGADFSRMDEAKRTFESEDLGPIVKKEANRCIVCMRCVRYCDEIMGEDALTAHQRGVWTEISSFNRQPLECEQCGNCVEVCPVGALTALPYRFQARPWDLRQHVTICPWCSNGCSVRLGVRGSEILRARGTEFRGVNQEYLCVRGRFGYEYVNSGERLSSPLLRNGESLVPAGFEEAATWAASRLQTIAAAHGPGSVAFLGGEKLTVEEQYLLQKLARAVIGTPHVDARTRAQVRVGAEAILRATGGGRRLLSFEQLLHSREVLVFGEDLQGEAPFAQAILIRGQHQKSLHLTVVHPRQVKLTKSKFKGDHLALKPGSELALLHGLTRAALDLGMPEGLPGDIAATLASLKNALAEWAPEAVTKATGLEWSAVTAAARRLREGPTRAILFGRSTLEHPSAPALLQAIENLGWATGAIDVTESRVMAFGAHAGSQGALDMGLAPDVLPGYVSIDDAAGRRPYEQQWNATLPAGPGMSAPEILKAAADGKIRALWITSDHWLRSAPDRTLVEKALAACELVIVSDLFLTETAERAHVVFPAASFAEKEGVMVNSERRLQRAARALSPRRGARADWEIFQSVGQKLGARWNYRSAEDVFREIARLVPGYERTSWATLLPIGPQWSFGDRSRTAHVEASKDGVPPAGPVDGLWLLAGGTLFLQGSLSHHTRILPRLAGATRARFHSSDAQRLGIAEGDRVTLTGASGGTIEIEADVDDAVPAGSVFVPDSQVGLDLNVLGAGAGMGRRVAAKPAGVGQQVGA